MDGRAATRTDERNVAVVAFGKHVRELRTAANLTRSELARAADMHPDAIRKIEAGLRDVTVSRLPGLASALGVTVADLVRPLA